MNAQAQPADQDRISSFRGVAPLGPLSEQLGPLQNLPGRWSGFGFNLIARPDFQGGNDIFLELNRTKENIQFTSIGSNVPNRGSQQNDINLFGVTYLQQISDATPPGGALHIEPGIWLTVPATQVPPAEATVTRLATIPHGDAVNLTGKSIPSTQDRKSIRPTRFRSRSAQRNRALERKTTSPSTTSVRPASSGPTPARAVSPRR